MPWPRALPAASTVRRMVPPGSRAFETWGGAPATIWHDSPSASVRSGAGAFHPAPEFTALQSACRFRAHHCSPGGAHERA
jgi:hypothetical protein